MTFSTLAWVPITLFVALVLGLVAATVNALWTMFHEED